MGRRPAAYRLAVVVCWLSAIVQTIADSVGAPRVRGYGYTVNGPQHSQTVVDYHQRTKHRLEAYAAGPGGLDWDAQPEPFRWFDGAEKIDLPMPGDGILRPFAELYRPEQAGPAWAVFDRLAALLERSLGLSAWKGYGSHRWPLRCNPSSGNLHPTEAYVVTGGMEGLSSGVYHYLSRDHQLERRCDLHPDIAPAAIGHDRFLIGLSSVHWREAWKYGERAYRYCQHDCGHAIAALRYAAAALGWTVRLLAPWGDADIAALLGLSRSEDFGGAERETPDVLLWLCPAGTMAEEPTPDAVLAAIDPRSWQGMANPLSAEHDWDWPVIETVSQACERPRGSSTASQAWVPSARPEPLPTDCRRSAAAIFAQRRSAQHFDPRVGITAAQFYRMLDMTLPRAGVAPWDSLPWSPRIHLVLFVHRVAGLRPGLYLLVRDLAKEPALRRQFGRAEFHWRPVADSPAHLPLHSLVFANCQRTAATLSCHQAIAGDSAFALAMLAEFDATLAHGPWGYRELFWEAGMLGQVLYLEAEAAGVRGTGIGCYFDDVTHDLLGIHGTDWQSLYHFTVGGALVDQRIESFPPYGHLSR